MLYTSRFQNPELKTGKYTPVRISLGAPRWKINYTIAGAIKELMPAGLRQIADINEFALKYYERLDSFGVGAIRSQFQIYEYYGKPIVLLCFEDIRKGGINNWCHRTLFSKWWLARTGEIISELKDDSKFRIEGKPVAFPDVVTHDKIRFVLADCFDVQAYHTSNGNESEVTLTEANNLIATGRASIANIELAK